MISPAELRSFQIWVSFRLVLECLFGIAMLLECSIALVGPLLKLLPMSTSAQQRMGNGALVKVEHVSGVFSNMNKNYQPHQLNNER